jgi:betaine-aldehyde dehydrogenase/aminobutyraldehyde dehydrogenase
MMRTPEVTSEGTPEGTPTTPAGNRPHVAAHSQRPVLDPATGHVVDTVIEQDASDVDAAVARAVAAFPEWSAATPRRRSEALHALADRIAANADRLAATESRNVGKPREMAQGELEQAIDNLRFFAGAARCLTGEPTGEYVEGYTSSLRREAIGVVGSITPWNYPLLMAVWKIAPALAAGNTCIVKPAEETPLSTLMLAELAQPVFPDGAVTVVTGAGATVGAALAAHPGIAMISLTGSYATGQAICRAAAETGKRVHLELGGNAPVLVFDDADITAAVEGIRMAGYWNAGQECAAACRVIATRRVYDALLERLVPAVQSITVGGPAEAAEMGPLISERQRQRVLGLLDRARSAGARVLCGGVPRDPGFFLEPAVVVDAAQDSEIVQQEVFGPVVTVQRAADEDEALAMANGVCQGLSASVWTRDAGRATRLSRALRFGTVWVNDHLVLASEMPWSGFAHSGHGHDQSVLAIQDYTQVKHVIVRA